MAVQVPRSLVSLHARDCCDASAANTHIQPPLSHNFDINIAGNLRCTTLQETLVNQAASFQFKMKVEAGSCSVLDVSAM